MYFKLTSKKTVYKGRPIKDGLNKDKGFKKPNPNTHWPIEGLCYLDHESMFRKTNENNYIRSVEVPDGAIVHNKSGIMYRANALKLGPAKDLSKVATWRWLRDLGVPRGDEALLFAIKKGFTRVVAHLLKGPCGEVDLRVNLAPVEEALKLGHTKIAINVIENCKAQRGVKKSYSWLMETAAKYGNIEVSKKLLEHGATLTYNGYDKYPPFMEAVRHNHMAMVKYLVLEGSEVNATKGKALYIALHGGNKEMADMLMSLGAKDIEDDCIKLAIEQDFPDIVKKLVDAGANPKLGKNLEAAIEYGSLPIVKYLVSKGADPKTPEVMKEAAMVGDADIINFLVSQGASTDDKESLGWAVHSGHLEATKIFLKDTEVNPDLIRKCISDAAHGGFTKLVNFLLPLENGSTENLHHYFISSVLSDKLTLIKSFKKKCDENKIKVDHKDALYRATIKGKDSVIKFLLDGISKITTGQVEHIIMAGSPVTVEYIIHKYPKAVLATKDAIRIAYKYNKDKSAEVLMKHKVLSELKEK